MDFTLKKYLELLESLINSGYSFQTITEFIKNPIKKGIMLRHDVDNKKLNSINFAHIQAEKGVKGTYYFRDKAQSWDKKVIKEIHSLGHEVGYHYENLTTFNGSIEKAYEDFVLNLKKLRNLVPVTTICMHGSPRSPYDSIDIWEFYDYKSLGVIGEPYIDIDFEKVFYLTDTGRRWDGWRVSVRDRIIQQKQWNENGLVYHSTNDLIKAASKNELPDNIMMTFHPQRWHNKTLPWLKELMWQNTKNIPKYILIKSKGL